MRAGNWPLLQVEWRVMQERVMGKDFLLLDLFSNDDYNSHAFHFRHGICFLLCQTKYKLMDSSVIFIQGKFGSKAKDPARNFNLFKMVLDHHQYYLSIVATNFYFLGA